MIRPPPRSARFPYPTLSRSNANAAKDTGEPADAATETYTPATPSKLALTPSSSTDPAGTQQCVSAALADAYDNPNPGVAAAFSSDAQTTELPPPSSTDGSLL